MKIEKKVRLIEVGRFSVGAEHISWAQFEIDGSSTQELRIRVTHDDARALAARLYDTFTLTIEPENTK